MAQKIQRFEGEGQLIGRALTQPVPDGSDARAVAAMFAGLAGDLRGMANDAAQREGAAAGLKAGQEASLPGAVPMPPPATAEGAGVPVATIGAPTVDRIFGVESGGDLSAKNPGSSASGLGQFIDSTWLSLVSKYRPDLAAGRSRSEVLALRTNAGTPKATRALQREMVGYYAVENSGYLRSAGIDATRGNIYLAHLLGPAGARGVLKADPSTPVSEIIDADAIAANGAILAGKTAGQVAAWAARKMGGDAAPASTATPGAPAAAAVSLAPTMPRGGNPLQLRNDGTAYGDAYDQAALRAHGWRMEAALHEDLGAAYEANKDDPVALQQRMGEIKQAYLADAGTNDPKMRELLERSFAEKSLAYVDDARRLTELRRTQEASAAAGTLVEAQRTDIERQAYIAGGQPDGDNRLGSLTAKGIGKIDAMVAARDITPAEGEKQKRALIEGATAGVIRGQFAAQGDLAAKQAFADGLLEKWKSGEGAIAALDFRQVSALTDEFNTAVARERNEKTAETAQRKLDLVKLTNDDVTSIAATGTGVLSDGKPLDAAEIGAILGPDRAAAWQDERTAARHLYTATAGMTAMTPGEISGRLDSLQPKAGEVGFAERQAIYEKARAQAQKLVELRKSDPAAATDAAFTNVASAAEAFHADASPQTLSALIAARAAGQQALGLAAPDQRFLTNTETTALKSAMQQSPEAASFWAKTMAEWAPAQSDSVLGQLSDEAPQLAVAADIAIKGGTDTTLRRLTEQQAVEREQGYKPPELKPAVASTLARETFGRTFALFPGHESARTALAGKLFLSLSRERGAPTDLANPVAASTYREALQLAAGARLSAGAQFGGIALINGAQTLVPPTMRADGVEALVHTLTDEDLKAFGAPVSGNGIPVSAADIRSGRLVAVGDGVYRIAQDDPDSPSPRYAATADGGFWTLDIRKLAERHPVIVSPGSRSPVTGVVR